MTKVSIAIAVEKLQPKGFGRILMHRIARRGAAELVPFVQDAVEPGAHLHTDGSAAYLPLRDPGYKLQ